MNVPQIMKIAEFQKRSRCFLYFETCRKMSLYSLSKFRFVTVEKESCKKFIFREEFSFLLSNIDELVPTKVGCNLLSRSHSIGSSAQSVPHKDWNRDRGRTAGHQDRWPRHSNELRWRQPLVDHPRWPIDEIFDELLDEFITCYR